MSDTTYVNLGVMSGGKKKRDRAGYVQPNRRTTKVMAGHFSPSVSDAMREVAGRQGMTLQEAMAEAFDEYLRKRGGKLPEP